MNDYVYVLIWFAIRYSKNKFVHCKKNQDTMS